MPVTSRPGFSVGQVALCFVAFGGWASTSRFWLRLWMYLCVCDVVVEGNTDLRHLEVLDCQVDEGCLSGCRIPTLLMNAFCETLSCRSVALYTDKP